MPAAVVRRTVVVSSGPSSASEPRAPMVPTAAAADRHARKSRRFCWSGIKSLLGVIWLHEKSRLQFTLELVEEAPVGTVRQDLVGTRGDHAGLVEAQCIEPERVRRVVLAPAVVRDLAQGLERIVVTVGEPAIDQPLRDALRLGDAKVGHLEDGAQYALGRDRMAADEFGVARQHTTEIFRPRAIGRAVDDDTADVAGAQFLRLGGEAEERVDLAFGEQIHRPDGLTRDP